MSKWSLDRFIRTVTAIGGIADPKLERKTVENVLVSQKGAVTEALKGNYTVEVPGIIELSRNKSKIDAVVCTGLLRDVTGGCK